MTPPVTGRGPVLSVRDISKTFPGQRALSSVDLTVQPGEVHALLGHNGSGKSTLIKVLAGFHVPDAGGEVLVNGEPLELGAPSRSHERGLRFVHQDLALLGPMTVAENMAFTIGHVRTRVGTIDRDSERSRTTALMDRIGIQVDVDAKVEDLDPIDRAIVGIARALDGLDGNGGLLVLDEPTAALPPHEVGRLFAVVRDLRDRGVSCLYVTHRMDEVHELTDTFTVLRDGEVVQSGRTADYSGDELIGFILGAQARQQTRTPGGARESTDGEGRAGAALVVENLRAARVERFSLSVAPGEVVGIAGVMGSGREFIGPALTGAVSATADRYQTSRGPIGAISPRNTRRHGVVMVPGTRGPGSMIESFSVTENLTFATLDRYSRLGWLDRPGERRAATSWVQRFGVRPADPDRALRYLSGGNKQKVLVAKWLNTDPSVVVMDEPTAGVDVGASAAIHDMIVDVAAQGVACIVTSSDLDDLIAVATRVIVMDRGVVTATLSGEQIEKNSILSAMSGATDARADRADRADLADLMERSRQPDHLDLEEPHV
ncbi:sugar ABC transporter ATP-binding protein [Nocardioides soli]|uniref:Ribose transport system ATP-binding protein n=1 Tax=Nocardioides soli TaxID=1036020 RepID=A0A7W4W1Y0_9ACTN|nr:sugar ABC transporter ATP-binding protein [Nocardioides soli]MBB3045658.1 ribose transport system ATP-binding protein [Nocardioides soli]